MSVGREEQIQGQTQVEKASTRNYLVEKLRIKSGVKWENPF